MSIQTGNTLIDLLNETAATSRLNTIESALTGSGFGQKNFRGTWKGYTLNNRPTVEVQGRDYNVSAVGFSGLALGSSVAVRAGKNVLSASWR